ncbi:hypothetical protein LCGC14_1162470 [marine sediment metagenome]|uniref:Uncharacterized protein n=1 Tax=marine sediment metagenome TaxID=412755 RepID=A0A0F9LX89_9ZZZZ
MTRAQEEKLITQVGEMHGVLFRNGLVKRVNLLEKAMANNVEKSRINNRANIALGISVTMVGVAFISLISKLIGIW